MTSTKSKTEHITDMTAGGIYSHVLRFAVPIFISQVFQQMYNTADALIVGRYLGTEALAAVSSSGPLIFMMISFFEGVGMGAGVVISKYFGAKEYDKVSDAIHTDIAAGIICGVFLTAVGVFCTPVFLRWMKTDPAVLPQAVSYFRVYFSGVITIVLYNACKGIMNALGDSKRPLYYLIFSSLLNIALDILFVGVLGWGVMSAAAATVISQAASLVLCIIHLTRKGNIYTVEYGKIRITGRMLREILRYGVPSGIQNSVIAISNVIVQTQINSFGAAATAAYGAHSKLEGFAFLPITSFNMAVTTFISQNLGAGKHERAKKAALSGTLSAVILAGIIGVVYYIFAPVFISLFDKSPEVIAYGVTQARTVTLFYCLLAFSHSVAAICRGAGKAVVPMVIMLAVWCVIRIIYVLTVMRLFGEIRYVYMAYPITWSITSVIYLFYYIFSDWVHGLDRPAYIAEV